MYYEWFNFYNPLLFSLHPNSLSKWKSQLIILPCPAVSQWTPAGGRPVTVRWLSLFRLPADHPWGTVRSPCDHRGIIPRWPGGDRSIFGNIFPRKIGPVARRSPPDVRRRPGGRRRMAKLPQESADHPANFNCELNLPDRRRMSAGCVLKGCSIGGWPSDFCRIRAPDHHTVIRRSILPYCAAALNCWIWRAMLLHPCGQMSGFYIIIQTTYIP